MNKRKASDTTPIDVDIETKKPRASRVLLFLDLGDRKGESFPPKIFCEVSEKRWNVIDVELDEEYPELHISVYDVEFDLTRTDFKLVIKESEDPARFNEVRDFFTNILGQEISEDIRFKF